MTQPSFLYLSWHGAGFCGPFYFWDKNTSVHSYGPSFSSICSFFSQTDWHNRGTTAHALLLLKELICNSWIENRLINCVLNMSKYYCTGILKYVLLGNSMYLVMVWWIEYTCTMCLEIVLCWHLAYDAGLGPLPAKDLKHQTPHSNTICHRAPISKFA